VYPLAGVPPGRCVTKLHTTHLCSEYHGNAVGMTSIHNQKRFFYSIISGTSTNLNKYCYSVVWPLKI